MVDNLSIARDGRGHMLARQHDVLEARIPVGPVLYNLDNLEVEGVPLLVFRGVRIFLVVLVIVSRKTSAIHVPPPSGNAISYVEESCLQA